MDLLNKMNDTEPYSSGMEGTRRPKQGAMFCAEEVAKQYDGIMCMGITIHSHVPSVSDCTKTFILDEKFLLDYHHAGLNLKEILCMDLDTLIISHPKSR